MDNEAEDNERYLEDADGERSKRRKKKSSKSSKSKKKRSERRKEDLDDRDPLNLLKTAKKMPSLAKPRWLQLPIWREDLIPY